jgi:hypothetical protein
VATSKLFTLWGARKFGRKYKVTEFNIILTIWSENIYGIQQIWLDQHLTQVKACAYKTVCRQNEFFSFPSLNRSQLEAN